MAKDLPEFCYVRLKETGYAAMIKRNEQGYYPLSYGVISEEYIDTLNTVMGVTKAHVAAMIAGSMFGWDRPGADPRNYDADGNYLREGATAK